MKVGNMRYRGDRVELAQQLQGMGLLAIEKAGFDTRHWNEVLSALRIYKDLCGHVHVPQAWFVDWYYPLWLLFVI